jgi:hypothetical protein
MNAPVRSCLGLSLALVSSSAASYAQMPAYDPAGPEPPAIAASKSVIVANAGADSGQFAEPFTGDTGRACTEFFSALEATNRYVRPARFRFHQIGMKYNQKRNVDFFAAPR